MDVRSASAHGVLGSDGRGFVRQSDKRVRLTKKTPCPLVYRVSARPILDAGVHDPLGDGSPGIGRMVAKRVHGGPVQGAGWIEKELADSRLGVKNGTSPLPGSVHVA